MRKIQGPKQDRLSGGSATFSWIVTHPGGAHRDEMLAIAVLLAHQGRCVPIYRREPMEEDLADRTVAVIDCGNCYDPALLNFDHHQERGGDCAFRQVMKFIGYDRTAAEIFSWYEATNDFDVFGPNATLKKLAVSPDAAAALRSPFEEGLIAMFSTMTMVAPWLVEFLMHLGVSILQKADAAKRMTTELQRSATVMEVRGIKGIVASTENNSRLAIRCFRSRYCPDAAFSVCPDIRGEGQVLYRFDDDARIDFMRLEGDERIAFVHPGGFLVKTKRREDIVVLRMLLERSIRP